MPTGIEVKNLVKTYRGGTVRALNGISLTIDKGEIVGILGHNGAGKTSLLGCLLGLLKIDSGSITINNQPTDSLELKSQIGYLPERLIFDRWMTGKDFLYYHHALANLPKQNKANDIQQVFKKVDLETASDKLIRKYSRGMLQRIGFAQALLGNPQYLFLDEPTSGIDPGGLLIFRNILKELKEKGVTIILNSHQLDEVERVCDRVIFVSKGQILGTRDINELTDTERILNIKVSNKPASELTETKLLEIAEKSKAKFLRLNAQEVKFIVANDEVASQLLYQLISAQIPVIEATPEESRLEQMFLQNVKAQTENQKPN